MLRKVRWTLPPQISLPALAGRERKPTVRSPKPPPILLPRYQRGAGNICQSGDLAVAERHIYMLSAARHAARNKRRHDGITRPQTCGHVCHRDAHLYRRAIGLARDVHQPELGLNHDVVAGAGGVRACLPIARDGGVDQSRVGGGERGVVQPVSRQCAREVVLD